MARTGAWEEGLFPRLLACYTTLITMLYRYENPILSKATLSILRYWGVYYVNHTLYFV